MVECESKNGKKVYEGYYVLIDTWWNVNMINNDAWISEEIGFNRYMVECEFCFNLTNKPFNVVLIDTWWNVNCTYIQHPLRMYPVLIDTWWNVNSLFGIILSICRILVLIDTWWNVNSFCIYN